MVHGDEEGLDALVESLEGNLVNKVLSFSPAFIVRREENLNDVV